MYSAFFLCFSSQMHQEKGSRVHEVIRSEACNANITTYREIDNLQI